MIQQVSFKEVFKDRSQELEAEKNKAILLKEVNRGFREPLDRNVFKKTAQEKGKLYTMKEDWKKNMKICYPNIKERKQHNNPIFM